MDGYAAFSLFWLNESACAGQIRIALEYLMDHLGVPKRKKANNKKYSDLTLHDRISIFATNEPQIGAQLMALKWLGNTGSHEIELRSDDLLDAFEILEHSLGELIDERSKKIAALAKKLLKKHRT